MAGLFDFLSRDVDYRKAIPGRGGLLQSMHMDKPSSVATLESVGDYVPVYGDAIGVMDLAAELAKENPNYAAAGLLGTGAALGLIPGVGDYVGGQIGKAGKFIANRANQLGPVPTMNAIFPSGASIREVLDFSKSGDAIYHSGPVSAAEEMQNFGVDPSNAGPWIREVAQGAVDDVDEFLAQNPAAAWWSDEPDWVRAKVARAAGKPQSDVTIDDIRKHGHLALASADEYADDAFRIGEEGLTEGEYSNVTSLGGDRMRLYETPLYEYGDDGVSRYPFGIEQNEIVTGEAIAPRYTLTGDELVEFMQRRGDLPPPSSPANPAEQMAKDILDLRAAGRAGDVTEEMMAQADPQYMFANTPLPMDEASRMARALEQGRRDEFHGTTTGSDMVAPDAFRGSGTRQGIGFVTSDNPYVASSYADPSFGSVFPMLNTPLPSSAPRIDVGGNVWSDISVDAPVTLGDRVVTARDLSMEPADVGGVLSTNQLSRGASFDYPGIEFTNIMDRSIHAPRPRTDDGMEIMREFQRLASDPSNVTMRQDTRGMRSRFARFDPEFRHLRNLSAGVGGLGLLSTMLPQEEQY